MKLIESAPTHSAISATMETGWKLIVSRVISLIFGLVFGLDALLPSIKETHTVDRHVQGSGTDRRYMLEFATGKIESCRVGFSVFNRLQDGDEVKVEATRVMRDCTRIRLHGETLFARQWPQVLKAIFALISLAFAFGLLESEVIELGRRRG